MFLASMQDSGHRALPATEAHLALVCRGLVGTPSCRHGDGLVADLSLLLLEKLSGPSLPSGTLLVYTA